MAMSAIFYLKFRTTGAWLLLTDLNNPLSLLLVQLAVGLTVYSAIAGLSGMTTFVELRFQVLSYLGYASVSRTEGSS